MKNKGREKQGKSRRRRIKIGALRNRERKTREHKIREETGEGGKKNL